MYLGLDLSLDGTGLVIIDDDYKIKVIELLHVEARETERLLFLEEEFLRIIDPYKNKIKLTAYETPAFRADGQQFSMGEWAGLVKLNLFKLGINVLKVAPTQLKKYVIGVGRGDKSVIILDVYKNFGVEIRQNDQADAYVVARIAHDFDFIFNQNKQLELTKPQIEVINKMILTTKTEKKKELI
jgi:Holliday junction resolvasome RuvABC endonuclease subunit